MSKEKNIQQSSEPQSASNQPQKLATGNDQPPNISPEINNPQPASSHQPATLNTQPETTEMEVHKHPHHVTHKKKWGEYLLEFAMLFLAVFLGFLAENWREELVNDRKEKEYIKSYIEDLKLDTFQLRVAILIRDRIQSACDSLIVLLKSSDRNKHTDSIYLHGLVAINIGKVPYNDRTIQQLKNSGDMRLIRAEGISDSMLVYDQVFFQMRSIEDFAAQAGNNFNIAAEAVFDPIVFQSMKPLALFKSSGGFLQILPPKGSPPLMTNDPAVINRLALAAYVLGRSNASTIRILIKLRDNATRLIDFLRKKYRLE